MFWTVDQCFHRVEFRTQAHSIFFLISRTGFISYFAVWFPQQPINERFTATGSVSSFVSFRLRQCMFGHDFRNRNLVDSAVCSSRLICCSPSTSVASVSLSITHLAHRIAQSIFSWAVRLGTLECDKNQHHSKNVRVELHCVVRDFIE